MKLPIMLDGHIIVIYIDDLINVGLTFDECAENVIASIRLLNSLGFIVHPDKSIFLPKEKIAFLGFNISRYIFPGGKFAQLPFLGWDTENFLP